MVIFVRNVCVRRKVRHAQLETIVLLKRDRLGGKKRENEVKAIFWDKFKHMRIFEPPYWALLSPTYSSLDPCRLWLYRHILWDGSIGSSQI